jgi:chorismate mutase / prephenate dehydratase
MSKQNLQDLRTEIDKLDKDIQELITQRARLAIKVKEAKYAEEEKPNFYRPEREAKILQNVQKRNQENQGPLPDQTLVQIFREIMSGCLALQKPQKIAFLGPEGTYSQAAVCKHFGHATHILPQQTIDDVFREVESGSAHYGVVPVENSTEGGVNQTLDCFIETPLKICSEIELPIHHHLLSNCDELEEIQRIYAHQQSFAQCRDWLDTHLAKIEQITVNSNAEAARLASHESGAAAIAGQAAAEIYELKTLASRIEDHVNNTTRFAVLGQQAVLPTGNDKTSLILSRPNQSGALYHLLQPFAQNQVSMTRIESRPSREGIWEYIFFVDIEGHIEDAGIKKSLDTLQKEASFIKHLGSYPRAVQ